MPRWSSFNAAADRRLVHRLNEGDDGALTALYDAYAERLYDYVLSMSGQYKTAADIVHDTFIDACRRAPRMRDHLRLRSWLYGAARRRCVQRGRNRVLYWEPDVDFSDAPLLDRPAGEPPRAEGGGRPSRSLPRVLRAAAPGAPARRRPGTATAGAAPAAPAGGGPGATSADDLPPSAELRRLLEASLGRLDAGDQEALLLAVRHGLLPAEIGIVLGISSRRAAARVARSRIALEDAYATELLLAAEHCAADRRQSDTDTDTPGDRDTDRDTGPATAAPVDGVVGQAAAKKPTAPRDESPADADADADAATGGAAGRSPRAFEDGPRGARAVPAARSRRSSGPARWVVCRLRRDGQDPAATRDTVERATVRPPDHECADCERRSGVYAAALLALAPSPVLPAALRHRVTHTATDPELAGYRADIAARGGGLTPEGLPIQPDMPSPFTKRWLFAGGGMVGALVTAMLAALLMGPGLGSPTIYWPPFHTRPQPSITQQAPSKPDAGRGHESARPPQASPPVAEGGGAGRPSGPQQDERRPSPPASSPPASPMPPPSGQLAVVPAKVELYGTKTANVKLTAEDGPVTWNAVSSSARVSVSHPRGDLAKGRTLDVSITLSGALLTVPGEATVTFIDSETGDTREVEVVWGASLF
ncbi:RNA polymerase sigma factor [Actinomadura viridis]|nr:sigma-70 family RNA polymerase sigma factor [Actinomadura viridis]